MDTLQTLWNVFGEKIYQFLPVSPFTQYLDDFASLPYLGVLNWFFPIKDALIAMAVWLTVVTTYYTYVVILRWIKVVGD